MSYWRQHPMDTKRSLLLVIHSSFSHGAAPNCSQEGYSACQGCNSALDGLELAGPKWSHCYQPQMPRNPGLIDPRRHNRKHRAKQDFTVWESDQAQSAFPKDEGLFSLSRGFFPSVSRQLWCWRRKGRCFRWNKEEVSFLIGLNPTMLNNSVLNLINQWIKQQKLNFYNEIWLYG